MNKVSKQAHFPLGELRAERRHTVAALGYLLVDLGLGSELEFTRAQARDFGAVVEGLSVGLLAMADGAILPKQGRAVVLTGGDGKSG